MTQVLPARNRALTSVSEVDHLVDSEDIKTRRHKVMLVLGLAGIAFEAYFLAVLSSGTAPMSEQLNLDANGVGLVSAYGYVATLIAAATCGLLADRYGRVRIMVVAKLIAVVAALLMAGAPSFAMLVLARCIAGAAYGVDLGVAMAYLSENLPKRRQYLLNFWQAQWYISTVVALVIVLCLYHLDVGLSIWRWGLVTAAIFAFVVAIAQWTLMLDSPRWLAKKGRLSELTTSLQKMYRISATYPTGHLEAAIEEPKKERRWTELFSVRFRARTILANVVTMMQALQYYAVAYYLPVIALSLFGENFGEATFGSIVFNVFGIVGGIASIWVASKLGANGAAKYGFLAVAAMILILGVFFDSLPILLAFLVPAMFIFFHSAGPGVSGLTMAAMAYPSDLRGRGGQLATISQSIGGIVGLYAFPRMSESLGLSTTITIFVAVPLIGAAICMLIRWEPFDTTHDLNEIAEAEGDMVVREVSGK
ncbi:MFS transporter [Gordonia sp. SL306]|uniref:MFS transporter n=1 Tax=Gordonia sp. SL306 TaxID=2995145 RepID=UPI00226DEFE0|nr:MFS transporter [Gordonia sp. SL306]WAC54284.1 MFS transporter [Gordonia sp. SL306]